MNRANNLTDIGAALMDIGRALAPSLSDEKRTELLADWLSDDGAVDRDPAERTRRFLGRVRDELIVRGLHDEAEACKALLRVSLRGRPE